MKNKLFAIAGLLFGAVVLLTSCNSETSLTTGWDYNNPRNGGFQKVDYAGQETGPGLVFIEGGAFTMGAQYDDPMYDYNSTPRQVTVRSFYMDETEVRNIDYLEYLYWLNRVFGMDHPEVYEKALPDTLVWRDRLAYNEPLVELYLRHPAYYEYPVVGVSWIQATDYCAWRTDRVNEQILVNRGVLEMDPDQINENNFNTEAYLVGQYEGLVRRNLTDLNPNGTGERRVKLEDGILLPKYRLPTEAEWEYAALGLIGNTLYERVQDQKMYPWNTHVLRADDKDYIGAFRANFKRGKGDYAGVAGDLNDAAIGPTHVDSWWANDYYLYGMAGNVSEWVMDVYRPLSNEDVSDLNPFRGNVFMQKRMEGGELVEKNEFGKLEYEPQPIEEIGNRRNYRKADNINYLDGDYQSTIDQSSWLNSGNSQSSTMYDYEITTMLNDKARVYKGGSWKDPAYFMMPATRRFLDENMATDYIGFRCAMDRVGSLQGYY